MAKCMQSFHFSVFPPKVLHSDQSGPPPPGKRLVHAQLHGKGTQKAHFPKHFFSFGFLLMPNIAVLFFALNMALSYVFFSMHIHLSRVAPCITLLTKCHKCGGLKQQEFTLSQFGRPDQNQGVCRAMHPPREKSLPCVLPLWAVAAVLGVPWLVAASLPSASSITEGLLPSISVCVCVSVSRCLSFCKDISHWIRPHLNPV